MKKLFRATPARQRDRQEDGGMIVAVPQWVIDDLTQTARVPISEVGAHLKRAMRK